MNNYHWFCDFERDYNHIQNVINVNKAPVEILKIWHLFLLPIYIYQISFSFVIQQTCKPWILPASYKFSPVKISFLQKSRKLSVTKTNSRNIFEDI
jgi:hypothetical protein